MTTGWLKRFKMLPHKTLGTKTDTNRTLAFKQIKDRMTVLLCWNKTGSHKLMPLVIGKFGKPRYFHHINMNPLPALYQQSKTAWMTSTIFDDWFHEDFVPSVRPHLPLKRMETKAILHVPPIQPLHPYYHLIERLRQFSFQRTQHPRFSHWTKGLL